MDLFQVKHCLLWYILDILHLVCILRHPYTTRTKFGDCQRVHVSLLYSKFIHCYPWTSIQTQLLETSSNV